MANQIFQKFTTHSKQTIKNSFGLAVSLGHKTVTPRHILYSLSQQKGSVGASILNKARINQLKLKESIKEDTISSPKITQITLNLPSKKLLEKAVLIASYNHHYYVGTEHLLAAILEINDEKINGFLTQNNINVENLKRQINTALNSAAKFPDLMGAMGEGSGLPESGQGFFPNQNVQPNQPSSLEFFATNLTDSVIQKKIDPVIGRQEEIERLVQILSRRNKNNPVLLGDPGVGKTAIAEGLAKKIVEGKIPEFLTNKKIYALDISAVVAGTSFRGEFENRLRQILLEVKNNPDIILFIDELHNIIGAGSATGSMDAANILKPALARGEIRCIGATTLEDYKKHIESDPALERRFQPIIVNQPDINQTIKILQGIKDNYENFHQVKISEEAIVAAAELSERYITDRFLPDKAIDLIDEASSAIKIKQGTDETFFKIKKIQEQLEALSTKKTQKVHQGEFTQALEYKKQAEILIQELEQLRRHRQIKKRKNLAAVTKTDITKIIAQATGIPLTDLLLTEKTRLLKLEKLLAKNIIGQEEALAVVSESIRRARAGITNSTRPIGSFIFLGPSGVGKTELAKIIAQNVFNSQQALIRIDMSEFAESFNISKLIGAPAGYVGYREGAKLTDAVRRHPYSVVLFDEIEKAHPQIFNLLLQILEDGHLTDATGKKINFKNTIIIMTSNIGSEQFSQQAALGFETRAKKETQKISESFDEIKESVLKKLKNQLPLEFINRLDKIIVFNPLNNSHIVKIANHQLLELQERLKAQGLMVEFEPAVARLISKLSYSPEVGARAIRKNIQELIENRIANDVLSQNSEKITVKVKNDKIII